jgi:hypothetical protein
VRSTSFSEAVAAQNRYFHKTVAYSGVIGYDEDINPNDSFLKGGFVMAKAHIATCQGCGQQFDTFRGGYYNVDSKQYTCRKCGRAANQSVRGMRIGMKQTTVGMVLKLLFGIMFFIVSVDPGEGTEWDMAYFLTCLVLGTLLIAWGLIPWLRARREAGELIEKDEQIRARLTAEKRRTSREYEPKVCPGCGATGTGKVCEYCGTKLR